MYLKMPPVRERERNVETVGAHEEVLRGVRMRELVAELSKGDEGLPTRTCAIYGACGSKALCELIQSIGDPAPHFVMRSREKIAEIRSLGRIGPADESECDQDAAFYLREQEANQVTQAAGDWNVSNYVLGVIDLQGANRVSSEGQHNVSEVRRKVSYGSPFVPIRAGGCEYD